MKKIIAMVSAAIVLILSIPFMLFYLCKEAGEHFSGEITEWLSENI